MKITILFGCGSTRKKNKYKINLASGNTNLRLILTVLKVSVVDNVGIDNKHEFM